MSLMVFRHDRLWQLRRRLDLTWTEVRTSICSPSSNAVRNEGGLPVLAVRLTFRDIALQCIRKMVKNQLDVGGQLYYWEQCDLANGISYLVRLSPPCPILYRELWCIPIDPTWLSRNPLIYHVSTWLESFPDPPMELVAFWKQAGRFALAIQDFEYEWREVAKRWNQTIYLAQFLHPFSDDEPNYQPSAS
ncbi:hypothetical protein C8R45DRAFT_1185042 [Mycena sanguinolenta]|nr:hypothetical protein C8R45DRAFT_1185042 [Mycena sanguinolenta]